MLHVADAWQRLGRLGIVIALVGVGASSPLAQTITDGDTLKQGGITYRLWGIRCRRCGTPGLPKIRPAELLQVGGPVTLAFLWCNSCIWEIDQAQLDKPAMVGKPPALSLSWLRWLR